MTQRLFSLFEFLVNRIFLAKRGISVIQKSWRFQPNAMGHWRVKGVFNILSTVQFSPFKSFVTRLFTPAFLGFSIPMMLTKKKKKRNKNVCIYMYIERATCKLSMFTAFSFVSCLTNREASVLPWSDSAAHDDPEHTAGVIKCYLQQQERWKVQQQMVWVTRRPDLHTTKSLRVDTKTRQ